MSRSPLTKRQDDFIFYISKGFNKTQAAIRAGYSSKTARQQGSRLFTNVDIQQRVDELGIVGLYTLEDVALNGKVEIAKVNAAKTLVEMAYGKPKSTNQTTYGDITIVMNKIG